MGTTLEVEEEGTTTYTVNADDEDQSSAVQHRGLCAVQWFQTCKIRQKQIQFFTLFQSDFTNFSKATVSISVSGKWMYLMLEI